MEQHRSSGSLGSITNWREDMILLSTSARLEADRIPVDRITQHHPAVRTSHFTLNMPQYSPVPRTNFLLLICLIVTLTHVPTKF